MSKSLVTSPVFCYRNSRHKEMNSVDEGIYDQIGQFHGDDGDITQNEREYGGSKPVESSDLVHDGPNFAEPCSDTNSYASDVMNDSRFLSIGNMLSTGQVELPRFSNIRKSMHEDEPFRYPLLVDRSTQTSVVTMDYTNEDWQRNKAFLRHFMNNEQDEMVCKETVVISQMEKHICFYKKTDQLALYDLIEKDPDHFCSVEILHQLREQLDNLYKQKIAITKINPFMILASVKEDGNIVFKFSSITALYFETYEWSRFNDELIMNSMEQKKLDELHKENLFDLEQYYKWKKNQIAINS